MSNCGLPLTCQHGMNIHTLLWPKFALDSGQVSGIGMGKKATKPNTI